MAIHSLDIKKSKFKYGESFIINFRFSLIEIPECLSKGKTFTHLLSDSVKLEDRQCS